MQAIPCPSCRQTMAKQRFERTLGGEVVLDLCFACQGIWFDGYESLQITPGGIVELFRLIHEHRDEPRQPLADPLRCPRCDERLLHGQDLAKPGGRFNYHRCLQQHGRFITFAQFMIEKGFVRQLTAAEIGTLAARVGTVRCTGCGAPVDIRRDHACSHCRAPIAILDPEAVEQALARYRQAEVKRTTIDVEALGDAIVMREREKSRRARERRDEVPDIDLGDLIAAGAELVWKLLRH
ncbi:MAG: zf-TFIIB domain-containing protein [Dechloromonas sp.]|jgi:hypothetical protein|nr:zf-TFIIB domain-containing protein [Dechloromonas sp.]